MYKLDLLEKKIRSTQAELLDIDKQIANEKIALEKQKEITLEMKIRRISMGEICQCSKENLYRNMGYVESFHGYPDRAKE